MSGRIAYIEAQVGAGHAGCWSRVSRDSQESFFHCPSETTSTVPSVTLMAVWSSMAYAGPADVGGPSLCLGHGVVRHES